jgi:6-phosphogluconolactonase (cycloisomerase 2 family)
VIWAVILTGLAVGTGADAADDDALSAVFALTNEKEGNELAVFARDDKGNLAKPVFVATGGTGTGTGLGNQGALALGDDGRTLYAVNPGSDSITVFRLGRRARPVQVVDSGGARPVSLTVHKNLLYVLNAGGATPDGEDTICGFEIGEDGRLRQIKDSVQPLSALNTGPAQIGFNRSGDVLTVTEKSTNKITLFAIDKGLPVAHKFVGSKGQTPFGFRYTRDDLLLVSEAFGGRADASAVSSYQLDADDGTLTAINASVPTEQTAACWVATTRNGEFAYTANTGSSTVTGFKVSVEGRLKILDANGVTARTGAEVTDLTVLGNRTLFVLNSGDGTVGAYDIEKGGALTPRRPIGGLPLTHPTGLVVR